MKTKTSKERGGIEGGTERGEMWQASAKLASQMSVRKSKAKLEQLFKWHSVPVTVARRKAGYANMLGVAFLRIFTWQTYREGERGREGGRGRERRRERRRNREWDRHTQAVFT